ncbi:uncharacterized protein LOC123012902 isoform X1 [Tribolium madens]|uniref:uncharacterized protein LOC123012902 isoform X1 n=1 Tax=Tribolium madens TaxID=41895 RepID=UPI001CF73F83|nr:uncharacterized protein LOC123012902 isoform X1 [Tribolium madens]XP_044267053.1 uncharacterized protein LOC123012902 isoform X1 [Tribolium madens]XP_044267054.1 uncharacterized protein LOC123012902 isoform X1 [Tribolium madens]
MIGRLFASSTIFRRIFTSCRPLRICTLSKFTNTPKLFIVTSYPIFSKERSRDTMENFDLHLKAACEKGEVAITQLMNSFREHILETSEAYKECLQKQIEIIDEATKVGAMSAKWDELPEYRSIATDLSQQLNTFAATVHTIGEIAKNETLQYITQQQKQFQLIGKKTKELEKLLTTQMEEIKKLESKLLIKSRESIQKSK